MSQIRIWFWIPVGIVLVPSTILHVRLLLIVRAVQRKGQYKSLFFRLFFVQSLLELLLIYLYLAGQLVVKDQPQGGEFLLSTNGGYFAKFYYYGTVYYFLHVQVWGVVFQSFNRFLSVCTPFSKVRNWFDELSDLSWCFINTTIPFGMVFRQLLQDETYFIKDSRGTVGVYSPPHVIKHHIHCCIAVERNSGGHRNALGSVFNALCYALVIRKLIISKSKLNSNKYKILDHRREKMSTLVALAQFTSLCLMTGYFFILVVAAFPNGDLVLIIRHIYIAPVLIMTFISPWILTITDRMLRMKVLGLKFV